MAGVCGTDVRKLYLEDPGHGHRQEPVGYVLCSVEGTMCKEDGCSCRKTSKGKVNGSTKYFSVCVLVPKGRECVTSGDDHVSCAVEGTSTGPTTAGVKILPNEPNENESNGSNKRSTQNSSKNSTQKSDADSTSTTNHAMVENTKGSGFLNGSGENAPLAAQIIAHTSRSSNSMDVTVMIVIIVIVVVFVMLVSWVIRSYCLRRSKAKNKTSTQRNRSIHNTNFQAASPGNPTNRSSNTPSFPAFDRRPREIQTPPTGDRGRGKQGPQSGRANLRGFEPDIGRNQETNSGRGRRNFAVDFQPNQGHPMDREPNFGYPKRNPYMEGPRRDLGAGQGRNTPNNDAQFARNGLRDFTEASMQYELASGNGRGDNYGKCNNETAMRTPSREPRPKQNAASKSVRAPPNNTVGSSGGTVYTSHNMYDRVAQFAQLAAFEAVPCPPPPRPPKVIQSVAVSDAVSKRARAPAQNVRPAPPAPPAPSVSTHPGFYIDESPVAMEYDILSPKTARSLAPSIASSAATVVAGRNRPTPHQQKRRQQHSSAIDSYYESSHNNDNKKRRGENKYDASGSGNQFKASGNYDESFMSEASSMAWSAASDLSDNSYYRAPPSSSRARIPVIEAPHDDDDSQSEDAYSDWGQSTQQSTDDFRSTAASFLAADASFLSVTSDYRASDSTLKEREF